jgi:hypothetical protein
MMFVGLQGLFVGLGAGIHIGYYCARDAGTSPTVAVAGWVCYIIAFAVFATRAIADEPKGPKEVGR